MSPTLIEGSNRNSGSPARSGPVLGGVGTMREDHLHPAEFSLPKTYTYAICWSGDYTVVSAVNHLGNCMNWFASIHQGQTLLMPGQVSRSRSLLPLLSPASLFPIFVVTHMYSNNATNKNKPIIWTLYQSCRHLFLRLSAYFTSDSSRNIRIGHFSCCYFCICSNSNANSLYAQK